MNKYIIRSLLLVIIFAFAVDSNAQKFGNYTYFSSHQGVKYFYKVKYYKNGDTKIKWKVKNTNSYKVMAGFKSKTYTMADGSVKKLGGEAWYVRPYDEYSFISDARLKGRLTNIEIEMKVRKEK